MLGAFMLISSELISVVLHTILQFHLVSEEVDGQTPWYLMSGETSGLAKALL